MKTKKTTLTVALGTAFAASLVAAPAANAADNPFAMKALDKGYMVADAKSAEGKCGGMKSGEGKCGGMKKGTEGRCGMMAMDANKDGKVSKEEFMKAHEEMFADMDKNKDGTIDNAEMGKARYGSCGGMKTKEGKCGGMKY